MNSEEYIQTVRASFKASKYINDLELILPYIDELRKHHKKLQNELEYLLLDPISYENPDEREKLNGIAKEIKQICLTAGLEYRFFKLPLTSAEFSSEFKKTRSFTTYSYNKIDITDLVVFTKEKKQKINRLKDIAFIEDIDDKEISLAELDFTEEKIESTELTESSFIKEGNCNDLF